MNIIGTGLSGLVGSRVTELLSHEYHFTNLSLETGVDITDHTALAERISQSEAPWVFHFAAYTDVDQAENDRTAGTGGKVWKINVTATEHLVKLCSATGKRLLYVSTDYVFDGQKESYSESDEPDPEGWYGITKYEGELRVRELGKQGLIIRIANPYRSSWAGKPDFVHKVRLSLSDKNPISAPDDQIFVPTLIDDIAGAVRFLTQSSAYGIYHVVGSQMISPYLAVRLIAENFGITGITVHPVKFKQYFLNRSPRPLLAGLKNDKISKSGIRMNTFTDGLKIIRSLEANDI